MRRKAAILALLLAAGQRLPAGSILDPLPFLRLDAVTGDVFAAFAATGPVRELRPPASGAVWQGLGWEPAGGGPPLLPPALETSRSDVWRPGRDSAIWAEPVSKLHWTTNGTGNLALAAVEEEPDAAVDPGGGPASALPRRVSFATAALIGTAIMVVVLVCLLLAARR